MSRKNTPKKKLYVVGLSFFLGVFYGVSNNWPKLFLVAKQPKLPKENLFVITPIELRSSWLNFDFSWRGIGKFILNVFIEFFGAPIRLIVEIFHLITLNYFKKRKPVFDTSGGEKVLERKMQFNVSAGQGTRVTGGFVRGTLGSSNHHPRVML